jgi:hypothetical protein
VRQTAKGDIRHIRQFVKVQRLDLQIASAFELRKNLGHRSALLGKSGQIRKLGFFVP